MKSGIKNRTIRKLFVATALCLLCNGLITATQGAGLLIADGGFGGILEIKEHKVQVTINNGIAVTRVGQVFLNTEKRQVEALYTFPVPQGASVANFSMWINGKEMTGEVVEKERARKIYNSYKQKKRDPGLLEQADYKTFEMRIFPIAPEAEQRIEVTYYQELNSDNDWATYVYPLASSTRKTMQSQVDGRFSFNIDIKSSTPLNLVESPSHGDAFVVAKHSPDYFQAAMESTKDTLENDIVIAYQLKRPKTGIDLLTSKAGKEDGYFLFSIMAGEDLANLDEGMDYTFVMDISGSMGNSGKMDLSRESVDAFVNQLETDDRFDIITFNLNPNQLFGSMNAVNTTTIKQAEEFLSNQAARGGTILKPAINMAYGYADPDRILNVIVLSDGMTEQNERRALLELISRRPANTRVFCIGVGNEVNRPLLEQIAQDSGGLAAFISHGDNFARQAEAFRRKLTKPVATNLEIDFSGVDVYDIEPQTLPNLYHGTPIRLYGRYRKSGKSKATFTADIRGHNFSKTLELNLPGRDQANPEIERMWAWKKIDRLLKNADKQGERQSVIDEIVRLGEAYSIVSEYTSFLVLENDNEYKRWKIDRRNALRIDRDRRAQEALRTKLNVLRNKAANALGPQPEDAAKKQNSPQQTPDIHPMRSTPQKQITQQRSRNVDFNIGTGPIGAGFLVFVALLRKMRSARKH